MPSKFGANRISGRAGPPAPVLSSVNGLTNAVDTRHRGKGVPTPKMAELLAARIEGEIADAGWPVGEVLGTETELLQRFEVSRNVFREAVRILENHRVARMRPGSGGGLVVLAPDPAAITAAAALHLDYQQVTAANLFEARLGIELLTVGLAAQNIDEAGIARLRHEIEVEAAALGDTEAAFERASDLHVVIAELSGNPALVLFTRVLGTLTMNHGRPAFEALPGPDDKRSMYHDVHEAHCAIIEAIVAGDASLASHRMRRHLEATAPLLS
jgi:DNA-binding FadR family transcriptional regulator